MVKYIADGLKKNRRLLFFPENGGDKNGNHILVGSKMSVTCSVFKNEVAIQFSPLAFYSKIVVLVPHFFICYSYGNLTI